MIPLSCPDIDAADKRAVMAVLDGSRLSIGPEIEKFEAVVAAISYRKHGIAVNSGTSALHLCVKALGLRAGDEVITTPFSFVATTNCLLYEGVKPVFVDIDESYNLDPKLIDAAVTEKTKAILPVSVFGNTAHLDEYEQIAKRLKLKMIEDACESIGAYGNMKPAGGYGDCSVFAFYPNKQITTGEGGMVVTDSDEIASLCRSMRNQGRDSSAWLSHQRLGYNYRMSELSAALGYSQAKRLDEIVAKRANVADLYATALENIDVILPPMTGQYLPSWFAYVVRLNSDYDQADRDAILTILKEHDIGCGAYFPPIHKMPHVKAVVGETTFPVCESLSARTIALPFYANMGAPEVKRVAEVLGDAITKVN